LNFPPAYECRKQLASDNIEWGKESYIDKCTRKKRMGIIWLKARIWTLRWIRRGFERGRCPLCLGEEDAKHILLKCSETSKWKEECVEQQMAEYKRGLSI
jgi:hypothetical protein